jgi:hypothetical protein
MSVVARTFTQPQPLAPDYIDQLFKTKTKSCKQKPSLQILMDNLI